MKTFYSSLLFLLILNWSAPVSAQVFQSQSEYNQAWEARKERLIDSLGVRALIKRDSLRAGLTLHPRHRMDVMEAVILIQRNLDPEFGNEVILNEARRPYRGGMFYIHDVMGAYLHLGDKLGQPARDAVRESLRKHTIYRGDTENHWLLYYSGMYLAAQTFPNQPRSEWFNGRSSDENLKEAREWIEHWMDLTTTIGQGEFDSPTYISVFLAPLYSLYTFAEDPVLKEKARVMLDWIWADYAVDYLDGRYAGGHSRDYTYDAVLPEYVPSVAWGWLAFGQSSRHAYEITNIIAALSDYRLPVEINNLANDREQSYTQYERKRTRHMFRHSEVKNAPVYKTLHMTSTYALGSLQGGILQPIQQHTWDVTWSGNGLSHTVFSLHPYFEGKELAMFFPEAEEWLSDEVDRYHVVYTDPNKWNSSSPYERTFQHENTLIVLYDIAEGAKHSHIDGYFPKSLKSRDVDDSGWIFMDTGNAWLAWYPLTPYEWIEEPNNWRLRSHQLRNGLIFEAASYDDYPTFDAFKKQMRSNAIQVSTFKSTGEISYTRADGTILGFGIDDVRTKNGQVVSLDSMHLFEGPRIKSIPGERTIIVYDRDRQYRISLDK